MIINWVIAKARQFLPAQGDGFDDGVNFDFALSAEIMALLCTQNGVDQQLETANAITATQFALDEHEQALA